MSDCIRHTAMGPILAVFFVAAAAGLTVVADAAVEQKAVCAGPYAAAWTELRRANQAMAAHDVPRANVASRKGVALLGDSYYTGRFVVLDDTGMALSLAHSLELRGERPPICAIARSTTGSSCSAGSIPAKAEPYPSLPGTPRLPPGACLADQNVAAASTIRVKTSISRQVHRI